MRQSGTEVMVASIRWSAASGYELDEKVEFLPCILYRGWILSCVLVFGWILFILSLDGLFLDDAMDIVVGFCISQFL